MKKIILTKRRSYWSEKEFCCDITKYLDKSCGLNKVYYKNYKNYIYDSRDIWDNKTLAIRVPGRTVGCVVIDDNVVIECRISDDLVGNLYEENINEELKQFVGRKLVFPEENIKKEEV